MKKRHLIIALVVAAIFLALAGGRALRQTADVATYNEIESDRLLEKLYQDHRGGVQVRGYGRVARILPDDDKGSRHQRFIVELSTGQTLLVAHNIDLAPRIENLKTGDQVEFMGEYEWNPEGGVIHWTHRDPSGKHQPGWLEHQGQKYW
ncbi:MAG TPA: DUF3465 domain-containing protein [Synergistetes bacterium]|nr:DUF3465 domain-containing protein [Synergistota bacterium]